MTTKWMLLSALALGLATNAACSRPASPKTETNAATPATATHSRADVSPDIRGAVANIDGFLESAWKKQGITPAAEVDDATFLRRVYLDLVGVVPDVATTRSFLADKNADRRASLVDRLTASDAFARHWTNYWDDVLMGERSRFVDRIAFRKWLHGEMRAGTPYDELVRELLTATGVNSPGGRRNKMMEDWELRADDASAEGVNGAVNFVLRGAQNPQDLAGATSRVFLGVQLQCAECHDHPTEKWKQSDFRSFTSAFMQVDGRRIGSGRMMGVRPMEIGDAAEVNPRMRRRMRKTGYGKDEAKALDGTTLAGDNPRQALAEWMTAPGNPWFSRAVVNRMWGHFLGRGFYEPIDDLRHDSEIAVPDAFDALADDFENNGYDLKRLMRVIVSTKAYQRAPHGTAPTWSAFEMRPMNDVQLLDSLVAATKLGPVLEQVVGDRLPRVKMNMRRQFRFTFDVDEDGSEDAFTGTMPQALMMMNGPLASAGSSALQGSTLGTAVRLDGGDRATLEYLYFAALSRPPSEQELTRWKAYVEDAEQQDVGGGSRRGGGPVGRVYRRMHLDDTGPRDAAYEDVLWALLNSSEFFFIH
jgi:hypothetical protein